jgi:hypothetical protein
VYAHVVDITGKIYSDQTGRFPVMSSKGNQYIMIVYDYDSAAILAEPLKNRTKQELVRAYSKLHQHLTERGLKPQLQKLDNKCPAALKQFMRQVNVDFQLVPPYNHQQNDADERAIWIWKDYFVAGLASLHPNFPKHLWCHLIHQCTQTLNPMRPSRINPLLSAEAQLNGAFNYNKTPLAPPDTKVLIHETPNKCRTWAVHGTDGWYLGGAPEHYRCYRVYATKKRAERIAQTVEFFFTLRKDASTIFCRRGHQGHHRPLLSHTKPSPCFPNFRSWQQTNAGHLATGRYLRHHDPKHREPALPPRVPTIPTLHQRYSTPANSVTAAPPTPLRVRFPLTNALHLIEPDEHRIMDPVPIRRSPRLHATGFHVVPPDATANSVQPCTSDTSHLIYPPAQAHSVIHATTGQAMNYRFLIEGPGSALWLRSMVNNLGRLAQGVGSNRPAPDRITGTNTISFIPKTSVPKGRQVTYCKQEARSRYEYMKIHISEIPDEIVQEYTLKPLATPDGWVYMESRKGFPGLKQAGRIADDRLTTHLVKSGYRPVPITPSLWTQDTRPIDFSPVVDDFGVKYVGTEHAMHLLEALRGLYMVTEDWAGTLFSGITIQWNYADKYVDISMPHYIPAMLHQFQHQKPAKHQGAPHSWTAPMYGALVQYATPSDDSPILSATKITTIQQKVGTLLYYMPSALTLYVSCLGNNYVFPGQSHATHQK